METPVLTPEDVAKAHMAKTAAAKETAKAEAVKAESVKTEQAKPKVKSDDVNKVEAPDATKASSPEEKKPEVKPKTDDVVGDAEKAVQENIRILEAKPDDLSDEDKAKRKELVTKQEAKRAESEEKKGKDNVQKRIDELTGKVKDLKRDGDSDKGLITELQTKISDLEKQLTATPEDKAKEVFKKEEDDRIAKYLDEDKELPKEQRREMSRDDLEEWLLEDVVAANEWLTDRQLRRREETTEAKKSVETKSKVNEIIKQQKESDQRVGEKHPELRQAGQRRAELVEAGKSKEDIDKIVFQEFPIARSLAAVLRSLTAEEHDEILLSPTGPELLIGKVEALMNGKKTPKPSKDEDEERERKIAEEAADAERQRIADLDVAKNSTRNGTPNVEETEDYKAQLALYKKAGFSKERLDKTLARRANIPGLG